MFKGGRAIRQFRLNYFSDVNTIFNVIALRLSKKPTSLKSVGFFMIVKAVKAKSLASFRDALRIYII